MINCDDIEFPHIEWLLQVSEYQSGQRIHHKDLFSYLHLWQTADICWRYILQSTDERDVHAENSIWEGIYYAAK